MKALIIFLLLYVPTDKILCPSGDTRVAVVAKNPKVVENILKKHNLKVLYSYKWSDSDNYTTVGQWQKEHTYKQARDLFFELAKQKEILRIY